MTLRAKLFGAFLGLAALAFLATGVALFVTLTWQGTAAQIERHYQRSLLLQRVRAGTFQALKEVDDALTGDHVDARTDFERALQPASRDFGEWSALADTETERTEVASVRAAHERLVGSARKVFELLPADRAAAIQLVDDEIDTRAYEQFRALTEQGVQADREHRRAIAAETHRMRTTTQVMLGICAFSILSLALLLAAFLAQDLFRPLRELAAVLERLSRGDGKARAEEGRDDDIGAVARSVNRLAANLESRNAAPDLALQEVELPALIHALVARHQAELVRRAIGLEVNLDPAIRTVMAERPALHEALEEMVRHALDALPERGGRLGFRTGHDPAGGGQVRVEVADDGAGGAPNTAMANVRAMAERHGGRLVILSEADRGTVAQLMLPQPP